MINYDNVDVMTHVLGLLYPEEYLYCSRASIYLKGYNDGIIMEEEYSTAKNYYGRLWNYVGD